MRDGAQFGELLQVPGEVVRKAGLVLAEVLYEEHQQLRGEEGGVTELGWMGRGDRGGRYIAVLYRINSSIFVLIK